LRLGSHLSPHTAPEIARLIQADQHTVREVIHRFDETGLDCLDFSSAGGCPRLLTTGDERFVAQTANTCPTTLGKPFTCWSIRALADHLVGDPDRHVRISHESLRWPLHRHHITLQRTRTWKESAGTEADAKLASTQAAVIFSNAGE
jgi:transposase